MVIYISTIFAGVSFLGIIGMIVFKFWGIKKHKINFIHQDQENNFLGVDALLHSAYNSVMNYVYRYGKRYAIHTVHMPKKASNIVTGHKMVVNLKNLINGKGDMKSKTDLASPYLKNITEHKNNIRNGTKK